MGLYNQLCGYDFYAPYIMRALELDPMTVPRFRDAFLKLDPEKRAYDLAVLTRTGRDDVQASYRDGIDALRKHPHYVRDEGYPALDDTYAVFVFAIPQTYVQFFTDAIKSGNVGPEPGDRWKTMMDALGSKEDTPERRRAMAVGERILAPVIDRLKADR